jgi:hypothetical protein
MAPHENHDLPFACKQGRVLLLATWKSQKRAEISGDCRDGLNGPTSALSVDASRTRPPMATGELGDVAVE